MAKVKARCPIKYMKQQPILNTAEASKYELVNEMRATAEGEHVEDVVGLHLFGEPCALWGETALGERASDKLLRCSVA